ncbi:TerC family protein [Dyella solisilvae]|uniref:TerC family protein n=1 Tax=Dyella solisilvae TaxID=1920168 RepID=A0A370K625_9GAMM|nr:TerC family protein [Dyella solisilvae]RDI98084.1 TerC family protein [Dyella solisilvae]
MELTGADFLSGLLAIILLDLVLAGDNAIVIALAARNLPRDIQTRAIVWGTAGAVAVRLLLTGVVVFLLELPGLMMAGGLLLLPIAWKLLQPQPNTPHEVAAASSFWAAMRTIIVADALMGMDNVLAIAGAAKGQLLLVVLGLAISVPLVVWGSTLLLRLIERFPLIIYLGAGAIAWTSARMISHDQWVSPWFEAHAWAAYALDVLLVTGVCLGGWLVRRMRERRQTTA